ncbi:hypothetical protein R75461_07859 [Paraburkholderia nemoris]|uniref:hypothetical protein n=1 Tax=Paraburkholderia nemoris TaxID=2793076 RepID=UPI00190C2FA1|nr:MULTISPECIES: hypothetical protein [Paraburkholderia]MBK3786867.1 hypothetical protein [Paraburkholderia aspalathi]CAE6858614.1 hypothetical protein R75461_07859 [Paraburkholderia nemoris]
MTDGAFPQVAGPHANVRIGQTLSTTGGGNTPQAFESIGKGLLLHALRKRARRAAPAADDIAGTGFPRVTVQAREALPHAQAQKPSLVADETVLPQHVEKAPLHLAPDALQARWRCRAS